MNSKELRRGNIVMFQNKRAISQGVIDYIGPEKAIILSEEQSYVVKYKYIFPVLLEKNILSMLKIEILNEEYAEIANSSTFLSVVDTCKDAVYLYWRGRKIKLFMHLHKLQNCYFYLTDEELL